MFLTTELFMSRLYLLFSLQRKFLRVKELEPKQFTNFREPCGNLVAVLRHRASHSHSWEYASASDN